MPRGKKAQVPKEVPEMVDNDNQLEEPVVQTTNTKTKGKKVAPKGRGRGKTVAVAEQRDDEVEDNAVVDDNVSESAPKKTVKVDINEESSGTTEKQGRGRGRKPASNSEVDAEVTPVEAETSEPPVTKKGRGRQKKNVVVAVEDEESEHNTSISKDDNAAADSVAATKGRKAKANSSSGTTSTDTMKDIKGNANKANEAVVSDDAEVAVPEKKKRGGRPKKNPEQVATDVPEPQQADEQGDEADGETVSSVAPKKGGRPKKVAEKKDQHDVAVTGDNGSVDEDQMAQGKKKKVGRGRKEVVTSASEVEPSVDDSELPIQSAPSANIEVRKIRGASRPTTPALPETPNNSESVTAAAEGKKGRGRTKKTPVVTPHKEEEEAPARGSRTKAVASKDTIEDDHVSEEPVVAKKRGGRPKKAEMEAVSPNIDEAGPSSPVRNERKRKEIGTGSEVAKKASKKK
ncbi:unnamed protein product [Caenorhabditis brenneri]